jgi:hypothetical protein
MLDGSCMVIYPYRTAVGSLLLLAFWIWVPVMISYWVFVHTYIHMSCSNSCFRTIGGGRVCILRTFASIVAGVSERWKGKVWNCSCSCLFPLHTPQLTFSKKSVPVPVPVPLLRELIFIIVCDRQRTSNQWRGNNRACSRTTMTGCAQK